MNISDKSPIVLVAFGTSTRARDTYEHFEGLCRQVFPDSDIRWAYTSHLIRRKLKQEEGVVQKDIVQVLNDLEAEGHKMAVVQSLHIIPGIAFDRLLEDVDGHTLKIGVGQPLLSGRDDIERTIDALIPWLPDPDKTVTILAGHGTDHPASSFYFELDDAIRTRGLRNVFLGNVTDPLSEEKALEAARRSSLKHVRFIPFMFVAGDHIENDIMGEDDDSWKSRLPGFSCSIEPRGLGYNEGVIRIFIDHLRAALENM